MKFSTIPYINYEVPAKVNNLYYMLGYKYKYIPYTLATDIANVMSHWKGTGKVGGFVGISSSFGVKYKKFLYSIPFDVYNETTPYKMAIEIIKQLSSKYDLRAMEAAIETSNDEYSFEEVENAQNPLVDLGNFNKEVKDLVNVSPDEYIPLDIVTMLKATENFDKLFSITRAQELSRMRAYSQIREISKYKLKMPSFGYKYTLKNYNIHQGQPKDIIIFRDVSKSAQKLEGTFKSLLLHFINSYKGKTIKIHEFTNEIVGTYILKSIEDIKEYYNKTTRYYISFMKFLPNFIKEYSECYIVSSGVTDVYPKMLNCIVNAVSKGHNESLKRLCDNTKGQYIAV